MATFNVNLSLAELKKIWTAADKDASSGIDFNEFCNAIEDMPVTLMDRQESMKVALKRQMTRTTLGRRTFD